MLVVPAEGSVAPPGAPPRPRLQPWFDAHTFRSLLTILLVMVALAFLYLARDTLIAFIFAILFAYVLEPVVDRLEARMGGRRGRAIAALYGALLLAFGLLLLFFGPRMLHQAETLTRQVPHFSAQISSGQIAHQLGQEHGWSYHTQSVLQNFLRAHQADIKGMENWLAHSVAQLARKSWWLVLIPILAIFFLKDGHDMGAMVTEIYQQRRKQEFLRGVLEDLHTVLSQFIRAQLILTGLALVVYNLGFALLRLPYPFALGTMAGLLEFIPMLGPLTSAVIVIAVAVLAGYSHLIWVLVFLGLWRLMQDYYISPRIMGNEVQLHPLAVIFGVLVGGEIGGVVGVYLSIPVIASLRMLVLRWRKYEAAHLLDVSLPETAPGEISFGDSD